MKLSNLEEQVGEIERVGTAPGDPAVAAVEHDSREVEAGGLFVALVGRDADGHAFVEEAVEAGAEAVLVQRDRLEQLEVDVPVLAAADTRRALGPVAAAVYGHPARELCVLGVTGTNGKSTTAAMLASMLESAGREVGLVGTLGYRWAGATVEGPNTTPESSVLQRLFAEMLEDGVDTVVMEVSSHGIATHRLRGTSFDGGLFTNLSQDHLDFHGDLETYRRVKQSFFVDDLVRSADRKEPTAALNRGDATGRRIERALSGIDEVATRTYGLERADVDVRCEILETSLEGTRLAIELGGEQWTARSPMLGRFNAENVAGAVTMAVASGVDLDEIPDAIEALSTVPGRLERVDGAKGDPSVFVDYAHAPDALRRVLATLQPLTPGRLIVVFGCGGDRDREKRPKMGRAAVEGADVVVVTSDNPRSESREAIVEDILEGIRATPAAWDEFGGAESGLWVEVDRADAIRRVVEGAGDRDVVLIAGKGHEQYQEDADGRRPFDDVRRARKVLEQIR